MRRGGEAEETRQQGLHRVCVRHYARVRSRAYVRKKEKENERDGAREERPENENPLIRT